MQKVFQSSAELAAHLQESYINAINYRVENNPTDTYGLIKANWGDEFQSLASGSESTEGSKEMMLKFLDRKANEDSKGPEAFAVFIWTAIPFNKDANNWTTNI